MFIDLVHNVALLLALGLLYDIIALKPHRAKPSVQQLFIGVVIGAIGIAVMLSPWEFTPGIIFDTRSILLGIAGLFFGTVPTLIAVLMTAALRLYQGGGGVWMGVAVIVTSGGIGLAWRHLRHNGLEDISMPELYLFGLVVHLAMLLETLLLPWSVAFEVLSKISLPVIILYPIGTVFLGKLMAGRLVRQRAEQQLHNEREKLFITLRSIGDGVITTDSEGLVIFINNVAEQLTGWSHQEASGQPLSEVFHIINEKTGLTCENPVNRVLASGIIIGLANHTTLIARDGTQRSIADSAAPIHSSAEGKIIGVVLVFRDVTRQKKKEEELLKIRKLESVGVLAGGIAHDFNNILTAILGNISLADIYIEKENKAHSLLKEAEKASLRAKDLTRQLLTFSKGGDPVRETASITQVITDSADFVLHGSNVKCRYALPGDLWLVDIDTGQMSQVIQNLVINARHAMPEGGEIDISCENIADITAETGLSLPGEKYIKITIADTGGGIPEKYLDKIFDPYFSTKQEGSGLGLAVTHSIINKHDGHISVRSKPGEGTTFTIYLPASAEQISRDAGEEAQKPEKAVKSTILIMDDEEIIRDLAKQMLSHFGHDVLLARDGREAIAIFKEHHHSGNPVDVIIMDLTIPGGMGGKETITEILKIDPAARAIVSSGYSNDPVMANYRQHGFKASIGKPFEMAKLKEIINSVLG
ncbi:MAG: LytS/YhcK type 5TM receptor domain-containing protein [Candidatus Fermentibacteria bacterium]|nr:LytS/YhcK type 5TM receptor domain-containing protein [Candidatus Fermentibacteria bacterium]